MTDLDSFAFQPGQQVQCKTRFDDIFKGEVVAFDLNSKILILRSPASSGSVKNHDLHFLVLDSVSDVDILEEPHGETTTDLPCIEMKYIKEKQATALSERLRIVEAVGNGVSQDGISLFTEFTKIYNRESDIVWKDKTKIVVMNAVIISPPYKEANCEPWNPSVKEEAVLYVKNVVRKFWESQSAIQKQPT